MNLKSSSLLLWLLVSFSIQIKAQPDSVRAERPVFQPRATWILPSAMITYGFAALEIPSLHKWDNRIQTNLRANHPTFHTTADNYLQYSSAFLVYGLNAVGIKGKHDFVDRSMIFFMANLIMGIPVNGLKKITNSKRPDGVGFTSFPSGHTAVSFVGAEFLRREYMDRSPWYGVAGYLLAGTTGTLRMLNNRHWFRDVMAGAGIGILSTELAYKLYPVIRKKLFPKRK